MTRLILTSAVFLSFELAAVQKTPKVELTLKPYQCVALHQGQKCYVNVELSWRAIQTSHYCLYSSQQDKPLQCWQTSVSGLFTREIVANQNILFAIKQKDSAVVLATRELEMAWVYKKTNRSNISWRMF
ncbi:MAG: DUF3019 domain-containing protein [Psychrosphaera sp.]|nr:DUF3019 domain-containing protein [Psychrosphaera sp.]